MATGVHSGTAEIVQFSAFQRRRSFGKTDNTQASVVDFPQTAIYPVIDTCWYHAEAVAKDDKTHN